MSPKFYLSLAAVPIFLIFVMVAFAQDANSQAAKEKADKNHADHFRFFAAIRAEQEQHRAVINDLIDTQVECERNGEEAVLAKDGSDQKKFYTLEEERCYAILEAKIDRTPLDVLTPFSLAPKGYTNLPASKRVAFYRLYRAYQHGLQRAKEAKP